MSEKYSKVPIYIAIIIALILVASGGYFLLGSDTGKSQSNDGYKSSSEDSANMYYYTDRGNGVITIQVHGTPNAGSPYRDYYINALEDGYSNLRSKCKVISRDILSSYEGKTVAYSVTVDGTCYIK